MYSMKATTAITGLTAETVRAWERRYSAIEPHRDSKGRRVYSLDDVERLTLLAKITQQGHAIGQVADLNNESLQDLLNTNAQVSDSSHNLYVKQIVTALVNYELDFCEELLRRAMIAMDPLQLSREVLFPSLETVGALWVEGEITIAQEHMFAALVKRMIMSMVNTSRPFLGRHPCFCFATLSGERHEFGILLTYLIAVSNNLCSYYLGPDLPHDELIKVTQKIEADVMVLSFVNNPPSDRIYEQITEISVYAANSATQVWVGGKGAEHLARHNELPETFMLMTSLTDFQSRSELLLVEPRARLPR
ncbi:MAG: MerR family transcriptional regulator [Gammaproteobacteria bacterium]|nr:MerR family transcriptional regulator [Gammaproteobacteria bacterium]